MHSSPISGTIQLFSNGGKLHPVPNSSGGGFQPRVVVGGAFENENFASQTARSRVIGRRHVSKSKESQA